jgi:hypothetical protein
MKFRFERETQTVRTVPENYCVTAVRTFSNGGSTDAAIGDTEKLGHLFATAPEVLEALDNLNAHLTKLNAEGRLPNDKRLNTLIRKAFDVSERAHGRAE